MPKSNIIRFIRPDITSFEQLLQTVTNTKTCKKVDIKTNGTNYWSMTVTRTNRKSEEFVGTTIDEIAERAISFLVK